MYTIVSVVLVVTCIAAADATSPIKCGKNEIYLKCAPRCPQKCRVRPRECSNSDVCEHGGCYCIEGYVRHNGVCWDQKQACCPKNEIFACGSACQNECSKLGEVCPIVNIKCNDVCYCIDGYARDANGKCIPESKCPPINKCPNPNEHYERCAVKIEPACDNRSEFEGKCVCNAGYVRDKNWNCIKEIECNNGNDGCKRNQIYQICGNACQGTCANPDRPFVCKAACYPGCFCKKGYLLNEISNECVKPSRCYDSYDSK